MANLSFEKLYMDFHPKVYSFVRKKVENPDIAEDLTAEIFSKILQNLDKYDEAKAAINTWVYTIANRHVTDYYRTRRIFEPIPDDNGTDGGLPEALVDYSDPGEAVMLSEELDNLADALTALKPKERELIVLHYYKDLKLIEIADLLEMSYVNAKVIHRKALNKLSKFMGEKIG